MNTYLYAYYTPKGGAKIKKMMARSFNDLEDKLTQHYIDCYDDLDANLSFDELITTLAENYDIFIGEIHEIDEFL